MADTPTDVLVAAYQDIDTANDDFQSLVAARQDHEHELHQHASISAVAAGVAA